MIPTQCPLGKDTRMCEYCDQKDTCGNTCDGGADTTPAKWGNISGTLADQKDLMAELDNRESLVRADIKANTTLIDTLQTLTSKVEGTANTAYTLANKNTSILSTVEGVANAAKITAESNAKRLTATEGVANNAKTLADSNATRLTATEGTANNADALSKENRKLISSLESRANTIEQMHSIPLSLEFMQISDLGVEDELFAIVPFDYGKLILYDKNYHFLFARNVRNWVKYEGYCGKQTGWRSPRISHDMETYCGITANDYNLIYIVPVRSQMETIWRSKQAYYRIPLRIYSPVYAAYTSGNVTAEPTEEMSTYSKPSVFGDLESTFKTIAAKYGTINKGHGYPYLCYKKMGIAIAYIDGNGELEIRSAFQPFTVYYNKANNNYSYSRWTDFTLNPGGQQNVLPFSDDSGIAVASEEGDTTTGTETVTA